jgi:hypothetical protein
MIGYGIVGAYGDDIPGLGSVVRSWKDLTAGWQWAGRKPKIDPEVVITISNVSPGGGMHFHIFELLYAIADRV